MVSAFAGGLLSFLSPCILPLVPPYLCFLMGANADASRLGVANAEPRAQFARMGPAIAFVLGFSTVFIALGATASQIGLLVSRYFDVLTYVAGIAIIILGLQYVGALRLLVFMRDIRFSGSGHPSGLVGSYVVGLAFAFGWTPCAGPILASILLLAGSKADAGQGMILLGVYALGIGVPFLIAALFVDQFARFAHQFRGYFAIFEKITGVALIAVGVLFLTGGWTSASGWLLNTFPMLGDIG